MFGLEPVADEDFESLVALRIAALRIDHLYVRPGAQGQGAGAWALEQAKARAREQRRDPTLAALKLSDANRFYRRHGFQPVSEGEFDIEYRWHRGGTP